MRGRVVRGFQEFAGIAIYGSRLPRMNLRRDGPTTASSMVNSPAQSDAESVQLNVPVDFCFGVEEPAQRQGWLLVDGVD